MNGCMALAVTLSFTFAPMVNFEANATSTSVLPSVCHFLSTGCAVSETTIDSWHGSQGPLGQLAGHERRSTT